MPQKGKPCAVSVQKQVVELLRVRLGESGLGFIQPIGRKLKTDEVGIAERTGIQARRLARFGEGPVELSDLIQTQSKVRMRDEIVRETPYEFRKNGTLKQPSPSTKPTTHCAISGLSC